MKQDIAVKWAEALESGEYMQALGRLRRPNPIAYCCLGVLCELYRLETGLGDWGEDETGNHSFLATPTSEPWGGTLCPEVKEWAGIEHADGRPRYMPAGTDELTSDEDASL